MTDHLSNARKKIEQSKQEAADVERVVATVGDELASRARIILSRIWPGTVGGLGYDVTWDGVAELLGALPPTPLMYYRDPHWAAQIKPAPIAQADAQGARSEVQLAASADFYIKAWRVERNTTAEVVWYIPSADRLIRVEASITNPTQRVGFYSEVVRDGHGHVIRVNVEWNHRFNSPETIRAGGGNSYVEHVDWPMLTFWWPEGTEWGDVLAPLTKELRVW